MASPSKRGMGSLAGRIAWWLGLRLAFLGAALAVLGVLSGIIAYYVVTPRHFDYGAITRLGRVPGVTFIDAHGDVLATRGAFHGDDVKLNALPKYLPEAFIATEDRSFYSNWGISVKGIFRAAVVNLLAGHTVQGGSTITQQLAKNLYLSNDRTMTRKFKELLYAVWLERHLSKQQILELYLNRIYFGAGNYGIDAASRYYFGVPATKVSPIQAAILAGLPKAPTRFAPTANVPKDTSSEAAAKAAANECAVEDNTVRTLQLPKATEERIGHVLDSMVRAHYMTKAEAKAARKAPVNFAPLPELGSIPYFVDYVYSKLFQLVPAGDQDLVVYTTLDKGLQRKAEKALCTRIALDGPLLNASEGALVALDPDGALRAMVGSAMVPGHSTYLETQFNRATDALRQPGSSFKPFVFLTALENGYTPDTIVEDAPITIQTPQGPWSPTDYEPTYMGRVTLRQALAHSLNTAAVRIAQGVGLEKVIDTAHKLGITADIQPVPSIALGTVQVTPLEMTTAYLPFATNGLKYQVHFIRKVTTQQGDVLYQYTQPDPTRVIDPDIASEMTNMMYQVIYQGTGRRASLGERPAAGKTGTSSDWRDAWFMGYTADLITGVWVGNDDDSPMKHVTGGRLPAEIWQDFMSNAEEGVKVTKLPGAYPSIGIAQAQELKNFYTELAGSMSAVATGGPSSGPPTAEGTATAPPPEQQPAQHRRKPRWWPF